MNLWNLTIRKYLNAASKQYCFNRHTRNRNRFARIDSSSLSLKKQMEHFAFHCEKGQSSLVLFKAELSVVKREVRPGFSWINVASRQTKTLHHMSSTACKQVKIGRILFATDNYTTLQTPNNFFLSSDPAKQLTASLCKLNLRFPTVPSSEIER